MESPLPKPQKAQNPSSPEEEPVMRVMVIGSGGREDALSRALAESKIVTGVIVAPGRKRL